MRALFSGTGENGCKIFTANYQEQMKYGMLPGEEYQIYPVSGARRRPRAMKDEKETRDLRGEGEMRK